MNAFQKIEQIKQKGFDIKVHRFGNYPNQHKVEVFHSAFLSEKLEQAPVLSLSVGKHDALPLDHILAEVSKYAPEPTRNDISTPEQDLEFEQVHSQVAARFKR